MINSWTPDLFGDPWAARCLETPDGFATLVRYDGAVSDDSAQRAILYVHGFLDYFFQAYLGPLAAAAGYRWYGLDLPGCGRSQVASLSESQVKDLRAYRSALDQAAHVIRDEDAADTLAVIGHSTGGLVVPLWVNARPGVADALVLNSPWFDLPVPRGLQVTLPTVIEAIAAVAPQLPLSKLPPYYARQLHVATGGEWEFNPDWKPFEETAVTAGFLRAITRGQRTLRRGLTVTCPILVCTSATSVCGMQPSGSLAGADAVLVVDDMWRLSDNLGADVTVRMIAGGIHDLALSAQPARDTYLATVFDWLADRL